MKMQSLTPVSFGKTLFGHVRRCASRSGPIEPYTLYHLVFQQTWLASYHLDYCYHRRWRYRVAYR